MTFQEFINSPQIKNALSSKDPFGELEKLFGNNPFAKNVLNMARSTPNNRRLEDIARNVCKEVNLDFNQIEKARNPIIFR